METTENFVSIGTELEPIEEDDVPKKKPVPISEQIVTDEKGRRRFHGAFTGGFSAGYFNTVGTKEGWTPSTFKSTRSTRSNVRSQNVQDFMDEEDLGAFGIAPQILRPTSEFEQEIPSQSRKRARPSEQSGPIPGTPVLDQIIQPVKDTVGVKILLRLGWRHGKGLGPLKSRKPKKVGKDSKPTDEDESTSTNERLYTCSLGDFQESDSDSDISDEGCLVLPDDNENVLCNPKENLFGLGYSGLNRNTLSFGGSNLFDPQLKFRVNNKNLSIRGEAFGIGAFEDEDEEVYSREDVSDYDFALETPEERKNRRTQEKGAAKKKTSEKDTCVSGFVRAKMKSSTQRPKFYPAPLLPKNFVPMHSVKQSRFQTPQTDDSADLKIEETRKLGLDRHKLTTEERKILLNDATSRIHRKVEEQELGSEEVRRKLAAERAQRLLKFTAILEQNRAPTPSSEPSFKPFVNNPEKQDRYEKYRILVAAGFQECLKDLQPLDMTEFEREREVQEFQRASSLYKPLAGVISSRFVSAKSHDISNEAPSKEVQKEKLPTEDPYVAAKMNLFGKLTHEVYEWHPDRLLSKRFNVPHPYPDSKIVGVVRAPDQMETATPSDSGQAVEAPGQPTKNEIQQSSTLTPAAKKSLFDNIDFSKPPPGLMSLPPPTAEVKDAASEEVQAQEQEESVPLKPSKDLFKEIFADTSSESEVEDEEEAKEPAPVPAPRRGQEGTQREGFRKPEPVSAPVPEAEEEDEEDAYGPRLPSQLPPSSISHRSAKYQVAAQTTTAEETLWVEKDAVFRNAKVKAHKSKKSKSKSRHKEKKTRHKDKSSSSKSRKKKKKRKSSTKRSRSRSDDDDDSDNSDSREEDDGDVDLNFNDEYLQSQSSERTKQLLSTLKTLVDTAKDK